MVEENLDMTDSGESASARITTLTERLRRTNINAPAELPSDDRLLIAVLDPPNDKEPGKRTWTFLRGSEYQQSKDGGKTARELDKELLYIEYSGDYHTKNGLWYAIKNPEAKTTKEYKDNVFREITTSLGLTAERNDERFEQGKKFAKDKDGNFVKDKAGNRIEKPVYDLTGEKQLHKTLAGPRRRAVAFKDGYVNGEQSPDCMVHLDDGPIKGFSRHPDDGLAKHTAWDLQSEVNGTLRLKSIHHSFQTIEHVERYQGIGAATNRLHDYNDESRAHNQNTHSAYIKFGSDYLPVNEFLEGAKVIIQAKADPSELKLRRDLAAIVEAITKNPTLDQRILMRTPGANSFCSPDFLAKEFPEHFKGVCAEHGVNPAWGNFNDPAWDAKPNWDKRLNSYASHARVLVEHDGGVLTESNALELPEGKSVLDVYRDSKEQIFCESNTSRGGRSGAFGSFAEKYRQYTSTDKQDKDFNMPDDVMDELLKTSGTLDEAIDVRSPEPPSGYDSRRDRLRGAVR